LRQTFDFFSSHDGVNPEVLKLMRRRLGIVE